MDQTPLTFVLDDGTTMVSKDPRKSGTLVVNRALIKGNGQLTIFIYSDGISRVRPTVIFRCQGKRIKPAEMNSWDKRVKVFFQPKGYSVMNQL